MIGITGNPVIKYLSVSGSEKKTYRWLKYAIVVLLITLATILMAAVSFYLSDKVKPYFSWLEEFQALGLLGIFLIAFVTNAFIVVALPVNFPLVLAAAAVSRNKLLLVAIVYAVGAVLGESVAYFLGSAGKKVIRHSSYSHKAEKLLKRNGKKWFFLRNLALTGFSITPWPPFDIIGLLAGTIKYPFWQFFIFCLVGRVIKYEIVFLGYETWKNIIPWI